MTGADSGAVTGTGSGGVTGTGGGAVAGTDSLVIGLDMFKSRQ